MNTEPTYNEEDGLITPPPFPVTATEWQRLTLDSRKHPFKEGDTVVPKLLPVDAEKGRNSHQIIIREKLTVRTVNSRGDQHYITFHGKVGTYDTNFFTKL